MFTVTVEMTQERKYQLREWINTHENATDQYFMGVYAGLKWMIDKVGREWDQVLDIRQYNCRKSRTLSH